MNRSIITLTAVASLATGVWAAPQDRKHNKPIPPTPPTTPTTPTSPDPLRGPPVQDRNVPGVDDRFGDDAPGARRREPRINHRAFMESVRSLASDSTPQADRLTPEQQDQVRAVEQDFRAAMQAFRAEHQDELEQLRRDAGLPPLPTPPPPPEATGEEAQKAAPSRPEAGGPPASRGAPRDIEEGRGPAQARRAGGDGATPGARRGGHAGEDDKGARPAGPRRGEANPEARQRLADLMKTGPKPEDYHTRIWALLTEPQQALLRQRLDDTTKAPRTDREQRPERQRGRDGQRRR